MPEGPEIYRVARQVAERVERKPLTELWFGLARPAEAAKVLAGQQIQAVETRGKALLLKFESDHVVYTHNQLYGRWMFAKPDRRPDTRRQLRLAISTGTDSALLYSASDIEVLGPEQLTSHPFLARVGLDILSSGAEPAAIKDWVSQPRYAGRQLAHLLLDQSFLAGVGNYLRSEILFLAGLAPEQRLRDLDEKARQRLADAVHTLMWRSVKTAGVTNAPDLVRELKTRVGAAATIATTSSAAKARPATNVTAPSCAPPSAPGASTTAPTASRALECPDSSDRDSSLMSRV